MQAKVMSSTALPGVAYNGFYTIPHCLLFSRVCQQNTRSAKGLGDPTGANKYMSPLSLHKIEVSLNPTLIGLDGKRNTLSSCEAAKTQSLSVAALNPPCPTHSPSPFIHCTLSRPCLLLFREKQPTQRAPLPSVTS